MCGIFGYVGKRQNIPKLIFSGLRDLEYRGYDSWGIAILSQNKILIDKNTGQLPAQLSSKSPLFSKVRQTIGIGHTRWATHGGVTVLNSHPHLDCRQEIALLHNGIIENYEELKIKLIKKGHKFKSLTDTEVAVHLIEEYCLKNSFVKSVSLAFQDLRGFNALVVFKLGEDKIIAVKNGSPLVLGFGHGENFISSDCVAFLPYTKKVYYLEENEIAVISSSQIDIFSSQSTQPKKIIPFDLKWEASISSKGAFPHFMLSEIYEQPLRLVEIARQNMEPVVKMVKLISECEGAYLIGCGSAAYAALSGTYLFSKIAKKHLNFALASEFSYQQDFLNKKSLLIALSQSGETMDTLEAVKNAKNKGAKIASLLNVQGSSLYRLSDHFLLLGVGSEKAVASTKALTAKLSFLLLLAFVLAGKIAKGQELILKTARALKKILSPDFIAKIKELAKILCSVKSMYVLGRGLSYPASLETALKIKEISYIHAEGLPAGELKHGPLALVEKGTPALVFLPNDETYGANLAGAMEVKARGGYIIGASFKNHEVFDYYLPIPDVSEATIIINIVFGQLLAYYLSVLKGLDPDKPRNLAKSVTVK